MACIKKEGSYITDASGHAKLSNFSFLKNERNESNMIMVNFHLLIKLFNVIYQIISQFFFQ